MTAITIEEAQAKPSQDATGAVFSIQDPSMLMMNWKTCNRISKT